MILQQINEDLLLYLNSFSVNDHVASFVWVFADAPIFFIPIFLIISWILLSCKKDNKEKEILLFIFYSCALSILFALIIQSIIQIDRPENYIQNTWKLLLKHIPDASFPSDHAAVSIAFLTSLYFTKYIKIFYIFSPFVLFMLVSRVIAWIHWPFDILAWSIIWVASSFIIFKFIKKVEFIKKINKLILKVASLIKL